MKTIVKTRHNYKNKNKKSKTKTQRTYKKIQKGGANYSIGNVNKDRNGYVQSKIISDTFNVLPNRTIDANQSLPILHITNLDMVSVFPNKDDNYIYHSLFIAQIEKNITEFETINWTIKKFINNLLENLNNINDANNSNKVKYGVNDVKINYFKFEIKNDINTINLSGNVYISNINKLNAQINTKVYDKMPDDTNNIIKDYM